MFPGYQSLPAGTELWGRTAAGRFLLIPFKSQHFASLNSELAVAPTPRGDRETEALGNTTLGISSGMAGPAEAKSKLLFAAPALWSEGHLASLA